MNDCCPLSFDGVIVTTTYHMIQYDEYMRLIQFVCDSSRGLLTSRDEEPHETKVEM